MKTFQGGRLAKFVAWSALALLSSVAPLLAEEPAKQPPALSKFFGRYCVECHGADVTKGKLRIDTLAGSYDGGLARPWGRILERVRKGDMPPEGSLQPTKNERHEIEAAILAGFAARLGRNALRPLNRREIDAAMNEVFGFNPPLDIAALLPAETVLQGFDNSADVIVVSSQSLSSLLQAARYALDHALVEGTQPKTFTVKGAGPKMDGWRGWQKDITPKGETRAPANGSGIHPSYLGLDVVGYRKSEIRDNDAILFPYLPTPLFVWKIANSDVTEQNRFAIGSFSEGSADMPEEGVVRVVVEAGATIPEGASPPLLAVHMGVAAAPLDRSATVRKTSVQPVATAPGEVKRFETLLRYQYQKNSPEALEVIRNPVKGQPRPFARTGYWAMMKLSISNQWEGASVSLGAGIPVVDPSRRRDPTYVMPKIDAQKFAWGELPRIHVRSVEIEAPYYPAWPPPTHTALLGDSSSESDTQARTAIDRVMAKAFRRSLRPGESDPYFALYSAERKKGNTFVASLKEALAAVFVSPSFLYLDVPKSVPNAEQIELATRMAAFFWSGPPDDELRSLADSGKLGNRKVISAQVDRMLDDPRAARFREAFLRQWLGLSELTQSSVSDPEVSYGRHFRQSIMAEPGEFFAELLKRDESLLRLLDADFAVVNERLASFYGLPGVVGPEFRRVPIPPMSEHRGGLLRQASVILAMTRIANENRWPIYRGAWMLKSVLDVDLPEPPNVPELDRVEALTIRDQIRLHQEHRSCAVCHVLVDPAGYGFQGLDAIGRTRKDQYALKLAPPPPKGGRPPAKKFVETREPCDPAGHLPRGEQYADYTEMTRLLLTKYREDFTRRLTRKLLAYGLRRHLDPADAPLVEELVKQCIADDYRARTFLKTIVTHPAFSRKS